MSDARTPRPMNEVNITSTAFLFAVMHDPTLPLHARMDAAVKLIQLGLGNYSNQPELRISITGGLSATPGIPGLEDFSPEMQRDLLWIKRCYELGIVDPDIDNWDIKKGHG
jgi:hypothetical protein